MAKSLSKTGITTGNTVKAFHITQSIDAFSGTDAYDIVLSGSLNINNAPVTNLTASNNISASNTISSKFLKLPFSNQINEGGIYFTNGTLVPGDEIPSIRGNAGVQGVGYLALGHSDTDTIQVKSSGLPDSVKIQGGMRVTSHITSSGNYSSSGDIFFTPSNASTGTSVLTINPTTGQVFRTGSYTSGGGGGGGSAFPFTGSAAISGTLSLDGPAGHITASGNVKIINGFISQSGTNTFAGMGKNIFGANIDLDVVRAYQIGGTSIAQWDGSNAIKIAETHAYPIQIGRSSFSQIELKGTVTASKIHIPETTAASQDLGSNTQYSVNGSKVEVRAITAAQTNNSLRFEFKLLNTSIEANSIVLGSFTGNHANSVISGSIISVATIAPNTASVFVHNETGGNIAADTPFTASFIVL